MNKHVHIWLHRTADHVAMAKPRAAGVLFVAARANDPMLVLLVKRAGGGDHAGTWAFPGGGIEPGETAAQAAVRECFEEIGTAPTQELSPMCTVDGFTTFHCRVSQPFEVRLNAEHTDYLWANPQDLPSPMHPGATAALRMWGMVPAIN